jgi:chemotaxis methyl-accepting protein methylase
MMPAGGETAFRALLQQLGEAQNLRFDAYKDSCLRRRVAVRMRACGLHTYDDYARRLREDEAEYGRFLEALTINVTKFYRNADMWNFVAGSVIPELLEARGSAIKCWSAGCASGEEPYTLAVLLLEGARRTRMDPLLGPCIDATDLDERSLETAATGRYPGESFSEMPNTLTARYFKPDGRDKARVAADDVRDLVRFRRHDLTREPPINQPYDLILFRNVVIYFQRAMQERIFAAMAHALNPGGALVLGKVETLFGGACDLLRKGNVRERVYRRP